MYEFDGVSQRPVRLLLKVLFFCTLWLVSNYTYLRALTYKGVMDVLALYATNSSFAYLLSWIILQKKFLAVRVSDAVFHFLSLLVARILSFLACLLNNYSLFISKLTQFLIVFLLSFPHLIWFSGFLQFA